MATKEFSEFSTAPQDTKLDSLFEHMSDEWKDAVMEVLDEVVSAAYEQGQADAGDDDSD